MSQSLRHPEILQIARTEGKVTVEGLANYFNVTLQTIRRDLTDLAETGRLERVHGGAVLPSGTVNINYHERRTLKSEAKSAIAKSCSKKIPNGSSIFINIGTSTEAVAQELMQHNDLMVVTNNINVANILSPNENCEILLTGGQLRRSDGGLIGNLATESLNQFKFDLAVIGCSAIDRDGDLLDFDIEEVAVSRAIMQRSRKTFLVTDQSKFSRSAPARIASLADINSVFTDEKLPSELEQRCATWGTSVIVAGE